MCMYVRMYMFVREETRDKCGVCIHKAKRREESCAQRNGQITHAARATRELYVGLRNFSLLIERDRSRDGWRQEKIKESNPKIRETTKEGEREIQYSTVSEASLKKEKNRGIFAKPKIGRRRRKERKGGAQWSTLL